MPLSRALNWEAAVYGIKAHRPYRLGLIDSPSVQEHQETTRSPIGENETECSLWRNELRGIESRTEEEEEEEERKKVTISDRKSR